MPRAAKGGVAAAKADAPSSSGPFGKPILVSEAPAVEKKVGIPMETAFAAASLPGDTGRIAPEEMTNKENREAAESAAEVRKKEIKEAFGYGRTAIALNPSPLSVPKVAFVFS